MAADVVKALQPAIFTTQDDDGFTEEIERMEIPRMGHVVHVANELPARAEHSLLLHLEEFRVVVGPGGQAQRLLIGIGRRGGPELSVAGCCIHGGRPRGLAVGWPRCRRC